MADKPTLEQKLLYFSRCRVHLITEYLRATKQNWVKFLTLKVLAAYSFLCYQFSMTSTHPLKLSSKAGINRQTNHFAFETNHLASIILNWMLMLGNQANIWARAWPRMAVCLHSFLHCDLELLSDLYFLRKAPKSVENCESSSIIVILINKGLILPDLAVN